MLLSLRRNKNLPHVKDDFLFKDNLNYLFYLSFNIIL